uniref:Uncharacterized protein n=1 Tax=Solibacter usitatus (strain Ellin6076) TaxID=234267 RepID=Q01UF0_SOLUE
MWYGNTKTLLESALRQLDLGASASDEDWKAQTDVVETCLSEMLEKSVPGLSPHHSVDSRYVHRPAIDKLNRAVPHVQAMLAAMRTQDRTEALKHGAEAMRRL